MDYNRCAGNGFNVALPAICIVFPPDEGGEPVPHVYSIIHQSAFPPEIVTMMGEAFDHAWESIEPQYEQRPHTETELARLALAKAVVMLAGLGNTDPETLQRKALRLMQMPSAADAAGISRPTANAKG